MARGWPWWLTRVRECGTEEGERGAAGGQLFTGAKSGWAGTAGLTVGAALQWWGESCTRIAPWGVAQPALGARRESGFGAQ